VSPENYERCSLVALLAAGRPHRVLPLPGSTRLGTQEGVIDTLLRLDLDFIKNSST
jgi:dipeptidyl-peptidase-4